MVQITAKKLKSDEATESLGRGRPVCDEQAAHLYLMRRSSTD